MCKEKKVTGGWLQTLATKPWVRSGRIQIRKTQIRPDDLIYVFGPIVWSLMATWRPHEGYHPRSGRTRHGCSEMTTAVSSFTVHTEVVYSTLELFKVSENQIKKQTLRKIKLGFLWVSTRSLIRHLTAVFWVFFCTFCLQETIEQE